MSNLSNSKVISFGKAREWTPIVHPFSFFKLGNSEFNEEICKLKLGNLRDVFDFRNDRKILEKISIFQYPKCYGFLSAYLIDENQQEIPYVVGNEDTYFQSEIQCESIYDNYLEAISRPFSFQMNQYLLSALSVQYSLFNWTFDTYMDSFFDMIPNITNAKVGWCVHLATELTSFPFVKVKRGLINLYLGVGLYSWNSDSGTWENANSGEALLPFQVLFFNEHLRYMPSLPDSLDKHPALNKTKIMDGNVEAYCKVTKTA